jgi:hypothetical protein
VKAPSKVACFAWTTTLGKTFTIDVLIKHGMIVVAGVLCTNITVRPQTNCYYIAHSLDSMGFHICAVQTQLGEEKVG